MAAARSGPADISAGEYEQIAVIGAPLLQSADALSLTANSRRTVLDKALQSVMIHAYRSAEATAAAVIEGDGGSRRNELVCPPWTEAGIGHPVPSAILCAQAITVQPQLQQPLYGRVSGPPFLRAALHNARRPHARRTRRLLSAHV
jgi:hypothetical protein